MAYLIAQGKVNVWVIQCVEKGAVIDSEDANEEGKEDRANCEE